jgi:hypothetical protein
MFSPDEYLTLDHTAHSKLFENQKYVWDALKQIASYLQFRSSPRSSGSSSGSRLSATPFSSAAAPSSSRARC